MNHDCQVDMLDWALFTAQYLMTGSGLSADFFGASTMNPPNGMVMLNEFAYLVTKMSQGVTPCTPVLVPTVCEGTIALSFNSGSVVSTTTQGPGSYKAYVIIDGFTDASTVEYMIYTTPNVTIVNQTSTDNNVLAGAYCLSNPSSMIVGRLNPMAAGPVTIVEVDYTLSNALPATMTLAPANCNYAGVSWTTEDASVRYDFEFIHHAGINGPAPTSTVCSGPTEIGMITGRVYADVEGPCTFDSGTDYGVAGIVVQFTPGPYTALTDGAGDYEIQLPPGAYTVSLAPGASNDPWKYFSLCQSPTYAVNVVANVANTGNNFALKPVGTITGNVYADYGDNCVFDNGTDVRIAGQMIEANPGGYIAYTDDNGDYSLYVPVGSYFVERLPITNDPWTSQSCQTQYEVDVEAEQTHGGNDFAIIGAGPPHCDVSVDIVSHGIHVGSPCPAGHYWMVTPCPDIEHEYLFVVKSEPTSTTPVPAGLEVDLGLNSIFTLGAVTSDFPITEVNIGPTNRLVYLDADLAPGQTCVIKVRGTPTGDGPYQAYASLTEPPCGGNNHVASISESDQCSCDPNDLAVAPAGCGPNGNIVGDEPLTYTVRFENIGTGAAHNITIFDALDADLDLSTLRILQTSHPVGGYQVAFGNTLAIGFEGIELPGIGDPANNKGYVVFSISPKPNLAEGTTIENTAEIVFDFNEPVVTNTTLNTIRAVPSPVVAFTYQDECDGDFTSVDFTYSGSTPDNATFLWNFGPGATPATSTVQNPADVLFTSGGSKNVTLTVTRFGCQSVASPAIVIEECAPICHDGVWEDGEFCGYDAYVTTGIPDMNHDCRVDGLDMGLFGFQFGSIGAGLSGDLNNSGDVGVTDLSLLLSKYGQVITTGCTSAAPLDTCAGTVALSFTDDPFAIDDNEVQATGPNTAYIVVDGADGARIVEYSIVASPNVVITSHTLMVGGNSWRSCGSGSLSARVFSLTDALPSGPVTVAEIQYTLTDSNPATLTIAASSCSARNRWATVTGDRSHDFDEISNAGINGPTPPPSSNTCTSTGIDPVSMPGVDQLGQNHPNPFNPTTTIEYALATQKRVNISIYSVRGELIRRLVDETRAAGWHQAEWNGRDEAGSIVASGVYLYCMQAGSFVETKKLVLLK